MNECLHIVIKVLLYMCFQYLASNICSRTTKLLIRRIQSTKWDRGLPSIYGVVTWENDDNLVPMDAKHISVWELCEMMAPKKLLSWLVTNPALWRIWLCVVFIFMGFIIQLTGGLHLLYPPSPFLPHSSQATQVVVSPLVSPVLGWCKERHCDFAFGANANLAIGLYVS